jgi:hypothetical protein
MGADMKVGLCRFSFFVADNLVSSQRQDKLDKGKIEALVQQLRAFPAANPEAASLLHTEADYCERHRERTRYPKFRNRDLFVGPGVIEAALRARWPGTIRFDRRISCAWQSV